MADENEPADAGGSAVVDSGRAEMPVSLEVFAQTLKPKSVRVPNPSRPGQFKDRMIPGQPDEIYIKLLRRVHGREKKTIPGWEAAIDALRNQPAHPSVTGG